MGTATLGFAGGPAIAFRIDPESIQWNFQVLTNVVETIGGRVIQVIGSQLDDMTVTGSFGQDHSTPRGESWRQAEAFLAMIQSIMNFQSADANKQAMMHPPAVFTYPPRNWRFQVYVKDFSDADNPGTAIVMTPGKFNQRYQLTLFIVQDASTALVHAGESHGVINKQAEAAIRAYMDRISAGVGWRFTQYTGLKGQSDQARDIAMWLKLNPHAFDVPAGTTAAGTGTATGAPGAQGGTAAQNKEIGKQRAARYGWDKEPYWSALVRLWESESNWINTVWNTNASCGGDAYAYGIVQACGHGERKSIPGHGSVCPYPAGNAGNPPECGGTSNASAQIDWGLDYIKNRYGDPTQVPLGGY